MFITSAPSKSKLKLLWKEENLQNETWSLSVPENYPQIHFMWLGKMCFPSI